METILETCEEVHRAFSREADRKYTVVGDTLVLSTEAQEIRLGERSKFTQAYKIIGFAPEDINTYVLRKMVSKRKLRKTYLEWIR